MLIHEYVDFWRQHCIRKRFEEHRKTYFKKAPFLAEKCKTIRIVFKDFHTNNTDTVNSRPIARVQETLGTKAMDPTGTISKGVCPESDL